MTDLTGPKQTRLFSMFETPPPRPALPRAAAPAQIQRKILNMRAIGNVVPPTAFYCGRRSKSDPGPYGNPYEIGPSATRNQVCDLFEIEFMKRMLVPPYVARMMADLDDKDLVCWCSPARCHCETIRREVGKRSRFPDHYRLVAAT